MFHRHKWKLSSVRQGSRSVLSGRGNNCTCLLYVCAKCPEFQTRVIDGHWTMDELENKKSNEWSFEDFANIKECVTSQLEEVYERPEDFSKDAKADLERLLNKLPDIDTVSTIFLKNQVEVR